MQIYDVYDDGDYGDNDDDDEEEKEIKKVDEIQQMFPRPLPAAKSRNFQKLEIYIFFSQDQKCHF